MPRSILHKISVVLALLTAACAAGERAEPTLTSVSTTSTTTSVPATTSTISPGTTTPQTTTSTVVPLGPELVSNGDFAAGSETPTGWELTAPGEGQRVDYVTESGESHVSFFAPPIATDQWPEARSQTFPVAPHTIYRLLAEARTVTEGRLFLALVFLDEDEDEILLRGIGSPAISTSEWGLIEGTIESPARAAFAYVVTRLAVESGSNGQDSSSLDVNMISVQEIMGS